MSGILEIKEDGRTLTVVLGEEIDHHIAVEMRKTIDKRLFECKPDSLILDFREVKFMDSSGIGLIIGRAELCLDFSASVRLVGLSHTISRLVRLSGIEKIRNISIL